MICDYYAVRKGYLEVSQLYTARKGSPYYFVFGVSWHAYTSYVAGILVNITGFVGAVGGKVPIGATYVYNCNYFGGFISSFIVYYLLTRISPIPGMSKSWNEIHDDGMSERSVEYEESGEGKDAEYTKTA
jgi:NCS1 family nucleobase:cation symporter-1